MTAMFVALRSGAGDRRGIALMSVRGELDDAEEAAPVPLHAELVPRNRRARPMSGAFADHAGLRDRCVARPTWCSTASRPPGLPEFTRIVSNVFDGVELFVFGLKCALFGLAVATVPAATGLEAEPGIIKSLPAVVLGGLIKLFFAIVTIEVASLMVKYA
jgi:phospholipid/cholesterol/gamma-HCH transport system permease protein